MENVYRDGNKEDKKKEKEYRKNEKADKKA